MQLVSPLILSRLDYCNSVLAGLLKSILAILQHVQNAAAGWFLNCDHVTISVTHYIRCTGCQSTVISNSSCVYWCTVHIPTGVQSIWHMFLSQLAAKYYLRPGLHAFLIYQQLHSASSSIKTGRAGIFLCRATCMEQSTSWPSEHTWHLNFNNLRRLSHSSLRIASKPLKQLYVKWTDCTNTNCSW